MVSTSIPINANLPKFATDISVVQQNLKISPLPSPKDFYSMPKNQSQISKQLQQSANVRYEFNPPNQSVLTKAVVEDKVKKLEDLNLTTKIILPVPIAQPVNDKNKKKRTTVVPSNKDEPLVVKTPSIIERKEVLVEKTIQDIVRTTVQTTEKVMDLGKLVLFGGIVIAISVLSKN